MTRRLLAVLVLGALPLAFGACASSPQPRPSFVVANCFPERLFGDLLPL